MAVALALYLKGFSIKKSIFVSLLTGLVEPIGGLIAIAIFTISNYILPFGLAFTGGAMLFIVSKEMIPETHKIDYETEATVGLIAGFIFMMILDTVLS
jgi:ZIP family zinc transporter